MLTTPFIFTTQYTNGLPGKMREKERPWAHVDLNHGPRPYQGRALTELSYGPNLGIGKCIAAVLAQREPQI